MRSKTERGSDSLNGENSTTKRLIRRNLNVTQMLSYSELGGSRP